MPVQKRRDELIAEGWILYHKSAPELRNEKNEYFVFVEELDELVNNKFDLALDIILIILEMCESDDLIYNVAAGPMEDLLSNVDDAGLDSIERISSSNKLFKTMLGGVWKNNISDRVWERILKMK